MSNKNNKCHREQHILYLRTCFRSWKQRFWKIVVCSVTLSLVSRHAITFPGTREGTLTSSYYGQFLPPRVGATSTNTSTRTSTNTRTNTSTNINKAREGTLTSYYGQFSPPGVGGTNTQSTRLGQCRWILFTEISLCCHFIRPSIELGSH